MTFATHYFIKGHGKWSGQRIHAICWSEAEYLASIKGLEVTGELLAEVDEFTGDVIRFDYYLN